MTRTIKFRGVVINRKATVGKEADIGDIVTGSLIVYNDGSTPHCWIRRMEKNYADIDYPVDPDSVAQLVGYDKDGREIYEGDELSDIYEGEYIEYVAKLKAYAQSVNPTGVIRFRFNNLTLKEDEDNDTND